MAYLPPPVGTIGETPGTTERGLPGRVVTIGVPVVGTDGKTIDKWTNGYGQDVPPEFDQSQSASRVSEVAPALLIPLDQTMLDGVTVATDSAPIDFTNFIMKNFFVNVSVNTGAVTVTIEGSEDGGTDYGQFDGLDLRADDKAWSAAWAARDNTMNRIFV